jgi:Zn-dependent protease
MRFHPDMGGTVRVLTVRGIPISIHASWLAIYALITWTLAVGYFPRALPDLPTRTYWINGLVAALLLFVSVLLHELSHSFVATAHGLRVRGITLHVFGGVSELQDEPTSPRSEFLMAVVGPLTSFAIAALLWGVGGTGVVRGGSLGAILGYLVIVNVAVGVFNLIPGFPLDGGRLLRAALWHWSRNLTKATYVASRVGVFVAIALMAFGTFRVLAGSFVGGMWLIVIGLFLRSSADASYTQTTLRHGLGSLAVRDVMTRDVVSIPAEATVSELVDEFWRHHFTSFPVVDAAGVPRGIVSVQQLGALPRERWATARVADLVRPLGDDLTLRPGDTALVALEKASKNGLGRLAVLEGGRLVGYLSLKDITHVLLLRGSDGTAPGWPARARSARALRDAA